MKKQFLQISVYMIAILILLASAGTVLAKTSDSLNNKTWYFLSVNGKPLSLKNGKEMPSMRISKDEKSISGTTGVNKFTGTAEIKGTKITLSQIAATAKLGFGDAADVEVSVLSVLNKANKINASGNKLFIYDIEGKLIAQLQDTVPSAFATAGLGKHEETSWVLVKTNGKALPEMDKVPYMNVQITDANSGRVAGFGGVNRYFGSWKGEGSNISFNPMGSTLMAGKWSDVESAFLGSFTKVKSVEYTNDEMTLLDEDGKAILEFKNDPRNLDYVNKPSDETPALPLFGTRWIISTVNEIKVPASTSGEHPYLEMDAGRFSGFAMCNRYFGSFYVYGPQLKFEGVASTRMICPQMDVENSIFKAIEDTATFKISGGELRFFDADGKEIMYLESLR